MSNVIWLDTADVIWLDTADVVWKDPGFSVDSGTFALTGSDVTFVYDITLSADSGTFALTGSDVTFITPIFFSVDSGTFALTGSDANLILAIIFSVDSGTFALTGSDVTFWDGFLDSGAFALTGSDVGFAIGLGPSNPGATVYLFTLTGAEDATTDIEIPMKSFQARLRSGDPTYLSVVLPGEAYASQINDRPNGTMEVDLAYLLDGDYTQRETIVQANLEDIRLDSGAVNKSISLTGHKTETYASKSIELTGATYKSLINGNIRYRIAEPNVYLKPGDTVTIGTDTFVANVITHFMSARTGGLVTYMELSET